MFTSTDAATCVVPEQRGGVASALLQQVARMGDDALAERARELAGGISAAEANLAAVLAEVERRGIPSAWECRDVVRFAGPTTDHPGTVNALDAPGKLTDLAQCSSDMASF